MSSFADLLTAADRYLKQVHIRRSHKCVIWNKKELRYVRVYWRIYVVPTYTRIPQSCMGESFAFLGKSEWFLFCWQSRTSQFGRSVSVFISEPVQYEISTLSAFVVCKLIIHCSIFRVTGNKGEKIIHSFFRIIIFNKSICKSSLSLSLSLLRSAGSISPTSLKCKFFSVPWEFKTATLDKQM